MIFKHVFNRIGVRYYCLAGSRRSGISAESTPPRRGFDVQVVQVVQVFETIIFVVAIFL
jgi:hypothetical protein